MKYDMNEFPKGSLERITRQLENDDLGKALSTWKQGSTDILQFRPQLNTCLDRLQKNRRYASILAAIHKHGNFAALSIRDLLLQVYEHRNYSSFIKYTHRLSFYEGMEEQIRCALDLEGRRGNQNVPRWQRRFEKTLEQDRIRKATGVLPEIEVTIEDEENRPGDEENQPKNEKNQPTGQTKKLVLRPLGPRALRTQEEIGEDRDHDPYILSQASRAKLERANRVHAEVVQLLASSLRALGFSPRENKLVDTYCECGIRMALFEVKSLTERNERDQIRQAISQLYEYRFLFDVSDASLWVVLSSRPMSDWMVDYLIQDRGIRVLWVENGRILGPSIADIHALSEGTGSGLEL